MANMTITLSTDEWDRVLAAMSEAPFKLANPLIGKILEQARQQTAKPQSTEDDRIVPRLQPVN